MKHISPGRKRSLFCREDEVWTRFFPFNREKVNRDQPLIGNVFWNLLSEGDQESVPLKWCNKPKTHLTWSKEIFVLSRRRSMDSIFSV